MNFFKTLRNVARSVAQTNSLSACAEDAQGSAGQGRREGVCSAHDRKRTLACVALSGALALLFVGPVASSAQADFGIKDFSNTFTEQNGSPDLQAGSHPWQMITSFDFNADINSAGKEVPAEDAKDVETEFPLGFVGNPGAVATCPTARFSEPPLPGTLSTENCPADSQVGIAEFVLNEPNPPDRIAVGLYNLATPPGVPAELGASVQKLVVIFQAAVRGDGGVTVRVRNATQDLRVFGVRIHTWGVPGDPSHDGLRKPCFGNFGGEFGALRPGEVGTHPPCQSSEAPVPYLTLPTSCPAEPPLTNLRVDSWQHPGAWVEELAPNPDSSGEPGLLEGCDQLGFNPTLGIESTASAAYSAAGLNGILQMPNPGLTNPVGLSESHLKKAVITLPEGMSINPSAGSGLATCSTEDLARESLSIPLGSGCPNASKIGTVSVELPLLGHPVPGSLYVASQGDNPFHSLLALYVVLQDHAQGVMLKIPAEIHPDPLTGRLTTTFENLPQQPFSKFTLHFNQGATSPLITPPTCGSYDVQADLTPWSQPTAVIHDTSSFAVTTGVGGGPCPSGGTPPFHPLLHAGSYSNAAGSYTPFYVRLSRQDGEQEFTHFSIKLPPGLSGKLAGVPYCPDAAIAAAKNKTGTEELAGPSCPAASEVGRTEVEAGVGAVLASAPGKVYLAGPYHGSNLSLVSITAAKVGPFDLGTVVVRFGLKVDPETAEVSVDGQGSDPIPHIIDGIPTHIRNIRTYVDRPDFALNPTSCKATSTASTVLGSGADFVSAADDQPVTISSPFQASNCAALGFKPKLALSLKGGTKRGATPAFKAVLTYPKGSYANIAQAQVTLPHSEFLEQSHIKTVCTRVQFKEGTVPGEKCPAASIYGRARAITPILGEPLEGPVYLRSSSHTLPDLVAALNNKQVSIDLDGRIDSVKGRIRNTFEAVPDAPVTKFTLEMQGGKKGLLTNSTDLCTQKNRAVSHFVGQNGKVHDTNPVLQAQCGKKGKKAHKRQGTHK